MLEHEIVKEICAPHPHKILDQPLVTHFHVQSIKHSVLYSGKLFQKSAHFPNIFDSLPARSYLFPAIRAGFSHLLVNLALTLSRGHNTSTILLRRIPDDFTRHGESSSSERVSVVDFFSPPKFIIPNRKC